MLKDLVRKSGLHMINTANIPNEAGVNNDRVMAGYAYNAGINLVHLLKNDKGAKTKLTNLEMNLFTTYQGNARTFSWFGTYETNKVYGEFSGKVIPKEKLLHFISGDCKGLKRTALDL